LGGDLVVELSDAEYNERNWTASRRELPGLDFRSRIPAQIKKRMVSGTVVYDTLSVLFRPSYLRSTERGSVRINLESLSGIGM